MRMSVIWRNPLAEDLPNQPGITIINWSTTIQSNVYSLQPAELETTCNTLRKKDSSIQNIGQFNIPIKSPLIVWSASLFFNCMSEFIALFQRLKVASSSSTLLVDEECESEFAIGNETRPHNEAPTDKRRTNSE